MAARAGEELLVGGDGEAEGALDHGPDGGWLHGTPETCQRQCDQSPQCVSPVLLISDYMGPAVPVRVISLSPCHK